MECPHLDSISNRPGEIVQLVPEERDASFKPGELDEAPFGLEVKDGTRILVRAIP